MSDNIFLGYEIYIDDKDEAARLGAVIEPTGNQAAGAIIRAPDGAAIEFNAPILGKNAPFLPGTRCITSNYFGTSANFPTDVATFSRKEGGWFGLSWLFGKTVQYYWRGVFKFNPSLGATSGGQAAGTIPQRYWIDGFENPGSEGDGTSTPVYGCCMAASRHPGGYGFRIDNSRSYRSHDPNERNGSAGSVSSIHQRFYMRVLRRPITSVRFWKHRTTDTYAVGMALHLSPSGSIIVAAAASDSALDYITMGTAGAPLEIGKWYRIDILEKMRDYFQLYINGVQVAAYVVGQVASGYGFNISGNIAVSTLGNAAATGHEGIYDFDDWVGSALPPAGMDSVDWLHGSKVWRPRVTGFGATDDGNFAPSGGADTAGWRALNARPLGSSGSGYGDVGLRSSVASARLAARVSLTDVKAMAGVMGFTGFVVAVNSYRAHASLNGQVGYKLPGASDVLVAAAEGQTFDYQSGWHHAFSFPTLTNTLQAFPDYIDLLYVKNSDASAAYAVTLCVNIELIGDWYPEDRAPQAGDPADLANMVGQTHWAADEHNAAFYPSPWSKSGPPQPAPVIVRAGTYTGNGKTLELAFPLPVQFFYARRVHATTPNMTAWMPLGLCIPSNLRYAAPYLSGMPDPNFAPAAQDDQSYQFLVRITGAHAGLNEAGTTYQYFAIMDPAQRVSTLMSIHSGSEAAYTQALPGGWGPDAIFVLQNGINQNADGLYFATSGLTAGKLQRAQGNQFSVAPDFTSTPGSLVLAASQSYYTSDYLNLLVLALRRSDGSGDTNDGKLFSISTYTGNGGASRTVGFSPTTGRRPMVAFVFASNTTSAMRDPTHTGTTSSGLNNANMATGGIEGGGIDSISVGSSLNTNGVTYDCIVFWAKDSVAGNNGWGTNGDNIPLAPSSTKGGGVWGPEPAAPTEPGSEPEPEPTPGTPESYDFGTDCVIPSTKIINLALSRLGVSKQVGNILTETSVEATAARLNYTDDVSATLRDFPWPFATRYAFLEQAAGSAVGQDTVQAWYSTRSYQVNDVVRIGTVDYYCIKAHTLTHAPASSPTYWSTEPPEEVNGDWLYAYRVPDRFVFARRLVNNITKARRDWDRNPPKFRLGSDETGLLIYCNEINAELEFTVRMQCAADVGDALFRSALTWRHAHTIAPALSRDAKLVNYCWQMYQSVLGQAARWAASEQQQAPDGDADWIAARD